MTFRTIKIDLINHCNATCPFCPYHGREGSVTTQLRNRKEKFSMLEFSDLERLATELEGRGLRPLVKFSGRGEPTIHPQLLAIVRLFAERGFARRLITNGLRLEAQAEALARLGTQVIVSIHGIRETHDAVIGHAGAYELALQGIRRYQALAGAVSIALVITAKNLRELEETCSFFAGSGVDIRIHHNFAAAERALIDPALVREVLGRIGNDFPSMRFVPALSDAMLERYYGPRPLVLNPYQCIRHIEEIEISSDGSIFVCDSVPFGNIKSSTVINSLTGVARKHFLSKIASELTSPQGLATGRCDRCCYQTAQS